MKIKSFIANDFKIKSFIANDFKIKIKIVFIKMI